MGCGCWGIETGSESSVGRLNQAGQWVGDSPTCKAVDGCQTAPVAVAGADRSEGGRALLNLAIMFTCLSYPAMPPAYCATLALSFRSCAAAKCGIGAVLLLR